MEPATPNSTPTILPQRDPEDLPLQATGHVHHLQDAVQAGPQLEGDTGATAGINTRLKYSLFLVHQAELKITSWAGSFSPTPLYTEASLTTPDYNYLDESLFYPSTQM